jgi:hypothetical protein
MFYFHFSIILDILVCNDNGSDRIAYSSLLAFLYEIPEDGPCGPKHVVKYDPCHNKGHANIVANEGACYYFTHM